MKQRNKVLVIICILAGLTGFSLFLNCTKVARSTGFSSPATDPISAAPRPHITKVPQKLAPQPFAPPAMVQIPAPPLIQKWQQKLLEFEKSRVVLRGYSEKSLADTGEPDLKDATVRRVQVIIAAPSSEEVSSMREQMKSDFPSAGALADATQLLKAETRYFTYSCPYRIVDLSLTTASSGKTDGPAIYVCDATLFVEETNKDSSLTYSAAGSIHCSNKVTKTYQVDDVVLFE